MLDSESTRDTQVALEGQCFDRASFRIHDPIVGDSVARVEPSLGDAITSGRRGRCDFTYPVGHDIDRANAPRLGEPFSSPAGQVRPNHIVRGQPDIHLDEDPPSARSALTVMIIVGTSDEPPNGSLSLGMSRKRGGGGDELTCKDLDASVFFQLKKIGECRTFAG